MPVAADLVSAASVPSSRKLAARDTGFGRDELGRYAGAVGRLLVAGLLGLCVFPALAQTDGPVIPGYTHSVWTTQDGLPQNIVPRLLQTRDGYLWVGTGNGLARFDGVRFRVFDMTTTPELSSGHISALHQDTGGALWIGTDRGLVRYRDGVFTRQSLGDDAGDHHVWAVRQDRQGQLWVATGRHVFRWRAGGWHAIPLPDVRINGLLVDRRGVLWIGTDRGLLRWHDGSSRLFTEADGMPTDVIRPRYEDRAGNLWVGGWGLGGPGLVKLDPRTGNVEPAPGALAGAYVNDVLETEDGRLWFAADGALFLLDRSGRLKSYPVRGAGENAEVMAIERDREGQIWLGMVGGRGGLHRLSPQRVTVLARDRGLPCYNAGPVTQGADGTVWAGVLCRDRPGLIAVRDGESTLYRGAEGYAPSHVASLLALPEGDLWVGTLRGELLHLEDERFTRYTAANSGLVGEAVMALYRDPQGALWIGTDAGLNRFHDGRWTTFTTDDGLVHDRVHWITTDAEEALWIGTAGGVSRYAAGRFTNFTPDDGLPPGQVRAIHVDEDGAVWIGTYGGGLARLAGGEITRFGTRDGLLDNSVHRILEDDRGFLWLSGDRGIRRVSRQELNAVADGRSTRLSVDIFDRRDGLENAEANGHGQPAGWKMRDGSLWFPTQDGIVRIDPEAVERTAAPSTPVIETVVADGAAYDPRRAVRVPPGAGELEIHYTAPAFTRPEQVRFRYRLLGHDDGWIQADTRRVAHYANLPPGSYRFQVIARGTAGLWSEEGATLALTLEPRIYERPIARLAALLLLAVAIYGAVRLRLARLRRRADALEATVADRTAELRRKHDSLELANRRLGEANERAHHAKDALEASHTHLLSVLAQLSIGVLVVDAEERVLFASEATNRLLGGDGANEAVGRRFAEVLPLPAAILAELRERLPTPRPGARTAARLEPRPGQCYWTEIEINVDPRDESQRILYLYDVTEAYDLGRPPATGGAAARLLGVSSAIQLVRAHVHTVAGVDATVLIEGETGTGKELVARAIHEASRRCRRPFVAVNCAGLTESLLASQLFGHRRGAFTGAISDHVGLFEAAQGGTLLLDEIGDMPLTMQTHLLRVLQEREIIRVGDTRPRSIDVRVLASTHRDLEREVEEGRFREDLLYRIRVARILLPSLRQRPEDVPVLAGAFLAEFAVEHDKTLDDIGREAMERLERHAWPGNVRELKSVVEWAAIHAAGPVVKLSDLPPELARDGAPPRRSTPTPEAERQILIEALKRTGGNRTAAARLLGIARSTFYRRLAILEKGATAERTEGPQQRKGD